MNEERMKEIENLAEAATPGRWVASSGTDGEWSVTAMLRDFLPQVCGSVDGTYPMREADADFIACARTAIPELLAALKERDAEVERYRSQIDKLAHYIIGNVPGEPSQSEGAVDTIIRVDAKLRSRLTALEAVREAAEAVAIRCNHADCSWCEKEDDGESHEDGCLLGSLDAALAAAKEGAA